MRNCKVCAILAILALSVPPAQANLINVPADYETIQAAIDNSNSRNDTILVQPGRYHERLVIRDKGFFLTSLIATTGDPAYIESTIIDADSARCVISIDGGSTVHIRGFTVTEGYQPGSVGGGGIRSECSLPLIEDMLIIYNQAGSKGGGVHATGGSARLVRCRIIGNRANYGGGISAYGGGLELEDCTISENTSFYGPSAVYVTNSVTLNRVLITDNVSIHGHFVILVEPLYSDATLIMDRVTIAGNCMQRADEQSVIYLNNRFANVTFSAVNTIIWGNDAQGLGSIDWLTDQDHRQPFLYISTDYSDIEGWQENLEIDEGSTFEWGENNIEADPLLYNPEAGDYSPIFQSPCHDAGDPDSSPDPDGSRADMGALFSENFGFVIGRTLREETGEPVSDVTVRGIGNVEGRQLLFETTTDVNGNWGYSLALQPEELARFELTCTAPGYPRVVAHFDIQPPDTLMVTTLLPAPLLGIDPGLIDVQLESGTATSTQLTLRNHESTAFNWSAHVLLPSDTTYAIWSKRASILATAATGDSRIQGVAFDGYDYFVAGASEEEGNMIYRISPEGACIDSFPQPGSSRYGFTDLEWDGEWLWGGVDDTLYALNRDGAVVQKFYVGNLNAMSVAYDPVSEIYWVGNTTTDLKAYDKQGAYLGRSLPRQGLRMKGLAINRGDTNGYPLYILNSLNQSWNLYKMNDTTGETLRVAAPPIESYRMGCLGLYCWLDQNSFDGWVMATVAQNPVEQFYDNIDVFQLRQFDTWIDISPRRGQIAGGSQAQILLEIGTSNSSQNWQLELGEHYAEIIIEIEGSGEKLATPVQLTVVEPMHVEDPTITPSTLSLSAFPNPFNSSTTINYSLPSPGRYAIDVIDIQGRLVTRLTDAWHEAGSYREVLNGGGLATGQYMLKLKGPNEFYATPVTLIK